MSVRDTCESDDRGFTLLEVLVASAILAVALMSLAQLLGAEVAANAAAGETTIAALLAAQKMEDLRAEPWESLAETSIESADYFDSSGRAIAGIRKSAPIERRWSVGPAVFDPEDTLVLRVEVRTAHGQTRLVGVRTRTR